MSTPNGATVSDLPEHSMREEQAAKHEIIRAWCASCGPCSGCNGQGMVGGLRSDGYHSEECPFCKGSGLASKKAAPAGDVNMWAVHIQGPDDIYAAPDREVADAVALVLNMQFKRHPLADDVHMAASVVLWPYGYEAWSAGKDLLKLEVKGLSHD